jgi:arylsulfatase
VASGPDEGYHLTEDLADEAIRMVVNQQESAPGKPFFLHFATGAMHSPHHVERSWADAYRGRFDLGWDRWRADVFARQVADGLVPAGTTSTGRPSWVPAWADLTADERRLYARMHEVYAGFLIHTDAQIGRLVSTLDKLGVLDDTLIRLGMGVGGQHAVPAVEAVHLARRHPRPADRPLAERNQRDRRGARPVRARGRSAAHGAGRLRCRAPRGVPRRQHRVHIRRSRGTRSPVGAVLRDARLPLHRGRRLEGTTDHVSAGVADEEQLMKGSRDFATDRWSLFRLADDFAEAHDLADEHLEVVRRLEQQWFGEAGRHHVLPLADSLMQPPSGRSHPAGTSSAACCGPARTVCASTPSSTGRSREPGAAATPSPSSGGTAARA